jgi:hypothetical protein
VRALLRGEGEVEMKPVDGLIAPGFPGSDFKLDLPDWVDSPEKTREIADCIDKVVRAANGNAVRVLRSMLGPSPGAKGLGDDFEKRLNG